MIPLDGAMAAELTRLRVCLESVRLDQVGAVLEVGLKPQSRVLPIFRRLNAIVTDPRPRDVIEGRDALVDRDCSAGSQPGSTAFTVGTSSSRILLPEDGRLATSRGVGRLLISSFVTGRRLQKDEAHLGLGPPWTALDDLQLGVLASGDQGRVALQHLGNHSALNLTGGRVFSHHFAKQRLHRKAIRENA